MPGSPIEHLRATAQALERGDLDSARRACDAALALAPRSADAWNLRGLIEFHAGRIAAARDALQHAVTIQPRYANAWRNLAAVNETAGDERGTARALEQAYGATPSSSFEDWYDLGVRAHRLGLAVLATQCFERALQRSPDEPRALNNLAVALNTEHRFEAARAASARLLQLQPGSIAARHTFAAIWSRATDPADLRRALEQAQAVIAAQPQHGGAHDCAAVVLDKLGDRAQAIEAAREAVRVAPQEPAYAGTLARLLEQGDQLAAAQAALAAALALAPRHAELLRLLGTVQLRLGDIAAADAAFAQALTLAPDDQAAIAQRALALHGLGAAQRARDLLGIERFLRATELAVPAEFSDAVAFNAALAQDIRRHSRLRYEPVGLAATGGYLTDDLLADRTPAILGFEHALRAAIGAYVADLKPNPGHPFLRAIPAAYRLNLWATRVAAQGTIDTHIHEHSWLSGAYYVELPPGLGQGEDHAGWIEFGRPHRGLPPVPDAELKLVQPIAGTLLLFPSYLYHRTLPFAGAGERISISFDLAALD